MTGRIVPLFKKSLLFSIISFILVVGILSTSFSSEKINRTAIVRMGSYWLVGPAAYFLIELVIEEISIKKFNELHDWSDEQYLAEAEKMCGQIIVNRISLFAKVFEKYTKSAPEQKADFKEDIKTVKNLIAIFDMCRGYALTPSNLNPLLSIHPITVIQGVLMVGVVHQLRLSMEQKYIRILKKEIIRLKKKISEISTLTEEKLLIEALERKLVVSGFYQRQEQIQKYWLARQIADFNLLK